MKKFALTAALFAFAATTPAFAKEAENSFTYKGVTYSYTLTKGEKDTRIDGEAKPGYAFHLVVRDGRVRGTVGGSEVAFAVPAEKSVVGDVAVSTR